ncbi:hypothetical protein [Methanorbis rubei]|uniref:Recombinase RecA n=1 Tax=Methanorbis rubei TaxID=3028300 RepID=A0AAE4MD52_9EURY|nr:hypothetical protein [Methanocorpusculaceae archaeon Cs1]
MPEVSEQRRIHPTNIPTLDKVLGGGVPSGTTVLVLSEPGAGGTELLQTSAMQYCTSQIYGETAPKGTWYPSEYHYMSLTTGKDEFKNKITELFNANKYHMFNEMIDKIHYTDFADIYFSRTHVPYNWYGSKDPLNGMLEMPVSDDFGGLTVIMDKITHLPEESIVIIDSLTALLPYCTKTPDTWLELVTFMRGLTRASEMWKITIVFLLTAGVLNNGQETELIDTCDGVIHLFWQKKTETKRQRQMYLQKFDGVLPLIDQRDMVIFNVNVTTKTGFEITNMRTVA